MLWILIGIFAVIVVSLAIYVAFFRSKDKSKDGEPPHDIYPMW